MQQFINHKDLPVLFERYELFIVVFGMGAVFLIAGVLFYEKAYKTTTIAPEVVVDVAKVNTPLFQKTAGELEQKKQIAPDLPIIDPFR